MSASLLLRALFTSAALLSSRTVLIGEEPPAYQTTVSLPRSGEARLTLSAKAPGCDWGKAGAESAVVTVAVDSKHNQEIVLFGGEKTQNYTVSLGALDTGKHTVSVTFRPDLSPKGAKGVKVEKLTVDTPSDGNSPDALAVKHAPMLYGRDDNAASDVPLLLYYVVTEEGDKWHIVYSLIWSNEDGGTGNDLGSLVARWGRSTDIEWVYDVLVSKATGQVEQGVIQAAGHQTRPFAGSFQGTHPLLRTSTTNNMVADTGTAALLFAPFPVNTSRRSNGTREAMMDAYPWCHAVAAKEMQREGKWETPGDPATIAASDIRNYLHVDYEAHCTDGALLAVRVKLKDGKTYFSDHERKSDAVGRSGWVRTTVELPPGTKAEAITEVAFVRRDTVPSGTARIQNVSAFLLKDDYQPGNPFLKGASRQEVTLETPAILFGP
jgi:hypothetical protein